MKRTREGAATTVTTKKERVPHRAMSTPLDTLFTKAQQCILLALIDARMAPLKARVADLEKALADIKTQPPPPQEQPALDLADIDLDSFLAADTPF
jgi:hypothetical protein